MSGAGGTLLAVTAIFSAAVALPAGYRFEPNHRRRPQEPTLVTPEGWRVTIETSDGLGVLVESSDDVVLAIVPFQDSEPTLGTIFISARTHLDETLVRPVVDLALDAAGRSWVRRQVLGAYRADAAYWQRVVADGAYDGHPPAMIADVAARATLRVGVESLTDAARRRCARATYADGWAGDLDDLLAVVDAILDAGKPTENATGMA